MPLPRTRKNVTRTNVHTVVELMLLNPDVADVECQEQADKKYTVRPSRRSNPPEDQET